MSESTPSSRQGPPRLPYMPGVDGLRALAVAAVVIYHLGAGWLPGGFLGVDVFFVISGYLITSLLLAEHRRTGRIELRRFWLRRARRLLPALFVLIVVVLAVMVLVHPGEVARLRGAVLAALRLRRELVLRLRRTSVLRAVRPAVDPPAPVVAGRGGAVLPAVAADHRAGADRSWGGGGCWRGCAS